MHSSFQQATAIDMHARFLEAAAIDMHASFQQAAAIDMHASFQEAAATVKAHDITSYTLGCPCVWSLSELSR